MTDLPPPLANSPAVPPAPPAPEPKHSGLGLASFIIALTGGVAILALFVLAGVLVRRGSPTNYPGQTLVGAGALLLLGAEVVAGGLGIAGLFQPNRKRVFAILGVVFSGLIVLSTAALMVFGLIVASRGH